MNKKVYILTILVASAAIVGLMGFNPAISSAQKFKVVDIGFYLDMPQKVVMKPNDTKIVPVSIYYPEVNALHLITGVTLPNQEISFIHTGTQQLPSGITASLDKKTVDLSSTPTVVHSIRDTMNLHISVAPYVKPGKYKISVLVTENNGPWYSRFLTIEVQ